MKIQSWKRNITVSKILSLLTTLNVIVPLLIVNFLYKLFIPTNKISALTKLRAFECCNAWMIISVFDREENTFSLHHKFFNMFKIFQTTKSINTNLQASRQCCITITVIMGANFSHALFASLLILTSGVICLCMTRFFESLEQVIKRKGDATDKLFSDSLKMLK